MKKKSLLLTAVATLGLTAATMAQNVPSYVPTNGLVGWWPFNGNANDESGNGNNGTVNGANLTNDRFGNLSNAYNFNGSTNWIDIPNNINFQNAFTISIWVFSNQNNVNAGIIGKWNDFNGALLDGQEEFALTVDDNANNRVLALLRTSTNPNSNFQVEFTNSLYNNNQWNLFTYVFNNNNISLYKNGLVVGNSITSGTIVNYIQNLEIGRYAGGQPTSGGNTHFNGVLDDIGIWNRAITQQEITALYNGCQLSVNTQPANQTININNSVQFVVSSSDPIATYQWQTDLGVGFQNLNSVGQYSGTTNDTLTISNVTLNNNNQPFRCIISSGSCSDTSNVAVLTVNNNVGINEFAQDNLFSVYPNPAQTVINVKADSKLVGESYSVIDNTGRVVLSGNIAAEITSIKLDNLSNGIYLFNVGDNLNQQFKILKH